MCSLRYAATCSTLKSVYATLEYVQHTTIATVELLRIHAVELPHTTTEVCIRCFDQEVVMLTQQEVCVA